MKRTDLDKLYASWMIEGSYLNNMLDCGDRYNQWVENALRYLPVEVLDEHKDKLAEKGVDTPFTYRRLAIVYRKGKKREEEIRTIKAALNNIPKSNAKHDSWFEDRLAMLNK